MVGVRNPFDLVLTEYARNREAGTVSAPQRLLRRLGASSDFSPADFERFVVRRYTPGGLYRLRGRVPFVPVDWTAGVDFVIRFEDMQAGLDEALRRVGVPEPHPLPHRNPTRSRRDQDYRSLYTPRARDVVSRAYERELRQHGYRFAGGEESGSDILFRPTAWPPKTWVTPTFCCEPRITTTGKESDA